MKYKYIDSEKLIAEIERKKEYALEHYHNQGDIQSAYNVCCEILSSIESLRHKQPEVDFEDKFAKFLERKDAELGAKSWSEEDIRELADYFYYGRNDDKQPDYKEAVQLVFEEELTPFKDGNQWCFLLGRNIQDGICGFGDTILDAAVAFYKDYTNTKIHIGELKISMGIS